MRISEPRPCGGKGQAARQTAEVRVEAAAAAAAAAARRRRIHLAAVAAKVQAGALCKK